MQEFSNIHNFRLVSEKLPIYRSANWDKATDEDLSLMYEKYGIRYRVDLRSPIEVWHTSRSHSSAEGTPADAIATNLSVAGAFRRHDKGKKVKDPVSMFGARRGEQIVAIREDRLDDAAAVSTRKDDIVWKSSSRLQSSTGPVEIKVVNVNFMNFEYIQEVVWNRLSWKERGKLLCWLLLGRTSKVAEYVGANLLKSGGLLGMYKDFIDSSGDAIHAALSACMEGLEECKEKGTSLSINCLLGRDRSGIISALLQWIAGDSIEDIAENYSKSEEGLAAMFHEMDSMNRRQGLGTDFNGAPRQVMLDLFDYLETKYGGVDSYLGSLFQK
jgi:hypothetical protein